jgi:hypothetical protein
MVQDARVVVKHLDEDVAPKPAQPLTLLEHGDSAVGGLVNRLERLHLHTSNGIDRMYRRASGNAVPARGYCWLPWAFVRGKHAQQLAEGKPDFPATIAGLVPPMPLVLLVDCDP